MSARSISKTRRWCLVASAAALSLACKRAPERADPPSAAVTAKAEAPLDPSELRTTNHDIAVGNFNATMRGLERLLAARSAEGARGGSLVAAPPIDLESRSSLVSTYLLSAQYFGRVSHYERASELAERLVEAAPADGRVRVTRARARAALHRFDDALADLEEARRRGVDPGELASVEASIAHARGRPAEALELLAHAPGRRDLPRIGLEAALAGAVGDLPKAERLFGEAERALDDVSPFPLAWLYLQRGLTWQRVGDVHRARTWFAAAYARLPEYLPARSHLAAAMAAMDEVPAAIRLLRPAAATAEDPECAGQLAAMLATIATSSASAAAEAAAWRARAAEGYTALFERHPEAYADHAARFWLAAGRDPARALAAAEVNLGVRGTTEAHELALQAALVANDAPAACRLARRASAAGEIGDALRALVNVAEERCASGASAPKLSAAPKG